MQYQSIIRLFEYCNVEYGDNMDVGRIKKILSAEFSIAPGGIITIDNFDYSKNDILEELESPDFSKRLRHHIQIWKQQSLLNCLEQNRVDYSDVHTWVELRYAPGFVRFVSPYFATSFDKVMGKILNLPDFEDAKLWMDLLFFVDNPEDEDRALNSLRVFLLETTRMLRNINSTTYGSFMKQIKPWAKQPSGLFLDELPDSLYKIKDDLVRAWVNFIYGINRKNRTLCYEINSELTQINGIDQELRNVILHNQKIFAGEKSGKRSGCSVFVSIYIIMIIIRFIISISGLGRGSSHNYPKPDLSPNTFQGYEKVTSDYFLELRDKYATISPTIFNNSNMNLNRTLFAGSLQYILVERPDTCKSTVINIINNSEDCFLGVYIMTKEGLIDLRIDMDHSLAIETNKNTLDFVFRMMKGKKPFPFTDKWTTVTLVSDFRALNKTYRTIQLDQADRVININKVSPSNKKELTLEVFPTPALGPDSLSKDHHNYFMTFHNAEWCVIPKIN